MSITLDGTLGITTPTYGGAVTAEYSVPVTGFKNRIINGAMVIDQRYAGTATANTISGYTVDRWQVLQSVTGKLIAQQNAGSLTGTNLPSGFTNYLGITSQSAYTVGSSDYYLITQYIEGYNIADLNWGNANAQSVNLSFWVRSSLTGTFGGALINNTYDRTYPFTYTISTANTWEQKSIAITGSTAGTWLTTNGNGMQVRFVIGAGSTRLSSTINQWVSGGFDGPTGATSVVGTNGATFYITGVQLEKGSTATSFDYRPYGTELALCQRYLIRFLGDDNNGGYAAMGSGYSASSTVATISHALPVKMRSYPSVSTGGNVRIVNSGASAAITGISNTQMSNQYGYVVYTVASGLTAGYGALMSGNADTTSYVQFSSEL